MWLINTSTLELKQVSSVTDAGKYVVLSHCWGKPEDEMSFAAFQDKSKHTGPGFDKVKAFCEIAQSLKVAWAWVDTCCINKESSAELSEAITSMWSYYERAHICCVFMSDVVKGEAWVHSNWWKRGWTLQELIAPGLVSFYDEDWTCFGDKATMATQIERLIGIPHAVLLKQRSPSYWSTAQIMSWAAGRETTKPEDRAYSLLGLFKINLPLLYGEGTKAFERLQLAILQKYPDESLLAWPVHGGTPQGVLAPSPDSFLSCRNMNWKPYDYDGLDPDPRLIGPPRVTSWGIELHANARKLWPKKTTRSVAKIEVEGRQHHFLWALTLTLSRAGVMYELPCTLVLVQGGPAPWSYQRLEVISRPPVEAESHLRKVYRVGEIESNVLLYLYFDRDVSI